MYTSDHGFHFGNLRLGAGKWNVYDTDTRVHMFMAGPGIKANAKSSLLGSHVDLAPTWLALANISTPAVMDGRSVLNQLIDPTAPGLSQATRARVEWEQRGVVGPNYNPRSPLNADGNGIRPKSAVYLEYHGLGPVGAPARLQV